MSKRKDFRARFTNPGLTVTFLFDNEKRFFSRVIEVYITCGKQCLSLRAHQEKTPDTKS